MKILFAVTVFCSSVIYASAQTWLSSNLNTNYSWNAVASSADGTKSVAAGGTGDDYIYTSTNSGIAWTKTSSPNAGWSTIAASADGTKLLAGVYGGLLYTSTNSGNTWISYNGPFGFNNWIHVCSSADGTKLMAAANNGGIFSSTNSGSTWSTNNVPQAYWSATAFTADGTRLAALTYGDDPTIYTSTNAGQTWKHQIFEGQPHGVIAASSDGSKLMVLTAYWMYLSTNWGVTWKTNNLPYYFAAPSTSSADLGKLWVGSAYQYQIYFSTNYGVSWSTNNLPNANGNTQYGTTVNLASSADGNNLVEVAAPGGIWVLQTTPSPQLNLTASNTNLGLSWLVPSTNFVLQQNPDLTTANWTTLTNTPTLNLTNLQEQVWLLPSNASGFFRLIAQ